MDGTGTGRDFNALRWHAQERDGAIVLRIVEDDGDEEEREPLAGVVLSREDVYAMLMAIELAEEKREASQSV